MITITKKVFDINQLVNINSNVDTIPRDPDSILEITCKFEQKSIQDAINTYMDRGNPIDNSFFVWVYDVSDLNTKYTTSINQIPLAEVMNLYIDSNENAVYAELTEISPEFSKYVDDENFTLSLNTKTIFNDNVIKVTSINGVIIYQDSSMREIKINDEVLLVTRKGYVAGEQKGVIVKTIEDIHHDEEGNISYKVDEKWFNSEGLLVSGRGARINRLNGSHFS